MTTPAVNLADFTTVLLLLRDQPEDKEGQRVAFKRFVANLPESDHVLRITRSGFQWDHVDVPVGTADLSALHDHLLSHRIGEIRFPVGLMTSTLLSLARIIAAPSGTYGSFDHLAARLDAAGCGVVPVLPFVDQMPSALDVTPIPELESAELVLPEADQLPSILDPPPLLEAKGPVPGFASFAQTPSILDPVPQPESDAASLHPSLEQTPSILDPVPQRESDASVHASLDQTPSILDPVPPPQSEEPVPTQATVEQRPSSLDPPPPPPPAAAPSPPPSPPQPTPRVDEEGHLSSLGPDALTEAKVGLMHFVTQQTQAIGPAGELIHGLAEAKDDGAVADSLNQLIAAGEAAARQSDWREVLTAAYGLVQLEGKIGEHRGFGIALRRLLPRSALEQMALLTARGNQRTEAAALLRRMGADGTEVLVYALVNAEDMAERRAYFNALKEMTEGSELLVHMLSHDQWFVVRNVADLCGELNLESAVPALAKQVTNSDERVRRAVAGALGRIGGSAAVDAIRRALHDPAPGVRLEAAKQLDGRRNKNLTMTLAVAVDEEAKLDVQKEMYLALGRIGSNEAIQALVKAAEPGGRFFKRKPTGVRLAAVAGLHCAGPSAANALKDMLNDEDKEVRDAVERSLSTLWE